MFYTFIVNSSLTFVYNREQYEKDADKFINNVHSWFSDADAEEKQKQLKRHEQVLTTMHKFVFVFCIYKKNPC